MNRSQEAWGNSMYKRWELVGGKGEPGRENERKGMQGKDKVPGKQWEVRNAEYH